MIKCTSNWVKNNYGSKRGLLNTLKYRFLYHLGVYKAQRSIDWSKVNRLVFLCHGNICRSPLGEHYAKKLGENAISCGLECGDGFDVDPRAISYGNKLGLGLGMRSHKTSNICNNELHRGDLIVAMEPKHLKALNQRNVSRAQITLAGLWLNRPNPYIHDPFSANEQYFSICESLVVAATGGIVERTKKQ
jgi:protein-tyrosine phosphatase